MMVSDTLNFGLKISDFTCKEQIVVSVLIEFTILGPGQKKKVNGVSEPNFSKTLDLGFEIQEFDCKD